MASGLNKIIFIGLEEPDISTDIGKVTYRRLVDITGVAAKDIVFEEPNTDRAEIIRRNFIKDPSTQGTGGYRIGNSLCIGTDSLSMEYGRQLEVLEKLKGMVVRTGYDTVTLTDLSESEISYWYKNGRYKKDLTSSNEQSEDVDDIFGALLGEDNTVTDQGVDTEEVASTPQDNMQQVSTQQDSSSIVDNSHDVPETTLEQDPGIDLQHLHTQDEEDDILSMFSDEIQDYGSSHNDEVIPQIEEHPPVVSSQPVPHVELQQEQVSQHKEDTDDFDSIFETMSSIDSTPGQTPHAEPAVQQSVSHSDNSYDSDDDFEEGAFYEQMKNEDASKKLEREREIQRRKEELARALEKKKQENDSLDRISNAKDVVSSSDQMRNHATDVLEDEYKTNGKKKTYKDYLTPEASREQDVVEKANKNFGPKLSGGYSKVSGGKVFLVTAGKGGVGKTLVSSGLASALALSKAKDVESGKNTRLNNTWLIESDYTASQMAIAYNTGSKHLGHLADYLANKKKNSAESDSNVIRSLIEENVVVDKDTGLRILACPTIVDDDVKLSQIPLAILLAIQYASERGDDVVVDHGNLTRAEYSDFDKVLSTTLANYVIIVTNAGAGSVSNTWSIASMLTKHSNKDSTMKKLQPNQVSIVFNKVTEEQKDIVAHQLVPYDVGITIPPINELREENSPDGDVSLKNMPDNVKKAIIRRCGLLLVRKLGYSQYSRYFSTKNNPQARPTVRKKNVSFFQRMADRMKS